MDVRYSANARDFKRYTTQETRDEFLIERIFEPNRFTVVYSHVDRIMILGAMPTEKPLNLEDAVNSEKDLGSPYFLAGREMGVINVGDSGMVSVDGEEYKVDHLEGIYIPRETRSVTFTSDSVDAPAKFYMASTPAHRRCAVKHIPIGESIATELGAQATSNARIQRQYIHPDVLDTCQLSMGVTGLKEGSVWCTMPPHIHPRRMEVYMYFDVKPGEFVSHFMGEPQETRHIICTDEQAVISPSWSIHSACGTSNYTFVWAMCGENRDFNDMEIFDKDFLR